jgi:hypothetical protein
MKTIGKYQVGDELGRSAAGATYRARDPFRNREFALKVLSPVAALSATSKEQLYRELAACWELTHRHIAKVQDIGELEGGVYIATDLLAGTGLSQLTAAHSTAEKLTALAQVCEALAFANSKGIAHGNLKPSNIFLRDGGEAVILDFGIGNWQSLLMASGVRLNGLAPNYLAPEQILGQPFDTRSDVFSVTVMLYEILAGSYPFQAAAGVIPREIVHADPVSLRKLNPQVPEELEQIVVRGLKKNPSERLLADELAASLYTMAQRVRREEAARATERQPEVPVETAMESRPAKAEEAVNTASIQASAIPVVEAPVPQAPPPVAAVEAPAAAIEFVPRPVAPPVQPPAPAPAPATYAPPAASPAAPVQPVPRPRPAAKPNHTRKRVLTYAIGGVLALVFTGVIIVRQNLGAPADKPEPAAPAPVSAPKEAAAPPTATKSIPPPPPAPSVHPIAPSVNLPPEDELILRTQVKPLWEGGQYAEAMRLVDGVLLTSPASSEARSWKKKIRAAQDAEAAIK